MATSRWRSSLGNIEDRLRRGLGLSGPVDLELAPALTPVVVSADLTLPGNPSQIRGRYWSTAIPGNQVAIGAQGSRWLQAEALMVTSAGGRPDPFQGGIQVLQLELDVHSAVAQAITFGMWYWALPNGPAVPLGGFNAFAPLVDPQRQPGERAPIVQASSAAIAGNAGGGFLFWERAMRGTDAHFTIPMRLFLNHGAAISIGNSVVAPQATDFTVTFSGRVF